MPKIDFTNIEEAKVITPDDMLAFENSCDHQFHIENDENSLCAQCSLGILEYIKRLQNRACRIGFYCELHQSVHGAEAEELRSRLEKLVPSELVPDDDYVFLDDVTRILGDVDARDSCAFQERYTTEKMAQLERALADARNENEKLREQLALLRKESEVLS